MILDMGMGPMNLGASLLGVSFSLMSLVNN